MESLSDPRLTIKIQSKLIDSEQENKENELEIPITTVANILITLNELVQATWDYAWWHLDDERFQEIRQIDAGGAIERENTKLVITDFKKSSIDLTIDWSTAIIGTAAIIQQLPPNLISNALWDLIKYSFKEIYYIIKGKESNQCQNTPLKNDILPFCENLAIESYKEIEGRYSITTDFYYKDQDQEVSLKINRISQEAIIKENEIYIDQDTKLMGNIVGFDISENLIGVRFELFPEQTYWCDVVNFNFDEILRLVQRHPKEPIKRIGFEVELAWRKGAIKRLLQIVSELNK